MVRTTIACTFGRYVEISDKAAEHHVRNNTCFLVFRLLLAYTVIGGLRSNVFTTE